MLLLVGEFNTGRGWYNVVVYPMEQLQLLLVAGHPTTTDDRCFVWPVSANDSISPSQIYSVTSGLKTVNNKARFVHLVCKCALLCISVD